MAQTSVEQFTLAKDMNLAMEEPAGLTLANDVLCLCSIASDTGTEYIAIFNRLLSLRSLCSFLTRAASDAFEQGLYGLYADWLMPDLAAQAPPDSSYYQMLQTLHLYLGESWTAFEAHRPALLKASKVEARSFPPETLDSNYLTSRQVQLELRWLAKKISPQIKEFMLKQLLLLTKLELQRLLRKRNRLTKNERKMAEPDLASRVLNHIRNSPLQSNFFFNTQAWQAMAEELLPLHFDSFNLTQVDGSIEPIYQRRPIENEVAEPLVTTKRHSFNGELFEYQLAIVKNRVVYQKTDATSQTAPEIIGLAPMIRWTNQDGKRTLSTDNLGDETDLNIAVNCLDEAVIRQADAFLGLVAVAYFSPEIRQDWPKRMGLPGSKVNQNIGAAQIPILAHIRRHDLEKSAFLVALEGLAEKV